MGLGFEELAWEDTPLGAISLRRRFDAALGVDIFEVKLGDEFLMSSLFPVAEIALARLGLAELSGDGLRVLVGGLGLGYTATAALADPRVASVTVVELLEPVIDWHRDRLLPESAALTDDPRTTFVQADFFAFLGGEPAVLWDAILLDIDHSPANLLDTGHADFYTPAGLASAARHLAPGGVFAVWSDDPPDAEFTGPLEAAFGAVCAEVVPFDNPLTGGTSANTVYVARAPRQRD